MEPIGRYQVKRELGRGAMGVVYLAEDPAIGRSVAIKTINLDNLSEPGQEQMLVDRLMREARSAGILSHPGIVTVYDIQQSGNLACIVMEFVEGVTLHDRMTSGDLQSGEVLSILEQTATAMDYAHSKGVLHRDIKPANLMFTTTGQVKVADFGIARLSTQKTATSGMALGTPSYMAPEQIASKPLTPAADQFSLAVVAFELLTGQKPFAGDSISALLFGIVFNDPIAVRSLNPSLPPDVDIVLRKALSKEPSDRYASCTEFVRALKAGSEKAQTWKPVRTVRGSQVAIPAEFGSMSGSMPTWGLEPSAPAPLPAPPPASVIPVPVDHSPPPAPPPAAPVAAEPKGKPETTKIAIAFGISFVVILAGYFIWQSMKPPEVAHNVASDPPASATPAPKPSVKELPKAKPVEAVPTAIPPVVAGTKPEPAGPQTYPVEIQTQPSRATVSVKAQTCVSPCQVDLPAGEYYVKAELEGYKTVFQMLTVPKVLELSLQLLKPTGTIEVRGARGAIIYVNGKAWKDKAPARFSLEAGSYGIVLEHADGSRVPEQKIELTEGKIVTLN